MNAKIFFTLGDRERDSENENINVSLTIVLKSLQSHLIARVLMNRPRTQCEYALTDFHVRTSKCSFTLSKETSKTASLTN